MVTLWVDIGEQILAHECPPISFPHTCVHKEVAMGEADSCSLP